MALISCRECDKQVSDQAVACPNCGAPVTEGAITPMVVTAPKSRSLAVLLAILLGGFGVHKFYLGSPGWGILYLLFCWTFIPAIIGVFEGVMYLSMSDREFEKQHARRYEVGTGSSAEHILRPEDRARFEQGMTSGERARYGRMTPWEQKQLLKLESVIEDHRERMERAETDGNEKAAALWRERLAGLRQERERRLDRRW